MELIKRSWLAIIIILLCIWQFVVAAEAGEIIWQLTFLFLGVAQFIIILGWRDVIKLEREVKKEIAALQRRIDN